MTSLAINRQLTSLAINRQIKISLWDFNIIIAANLCIELTSLSRCLVVSISNNTNIGLFVWNLNMLLNYTPSSSLSPKLQNQRSACLKWSEAQTTKPEVPGSNPGSGKGFLWWTITVAHESWLFIYDMIMIILKTQGEIFKRSLKN
jgi:hypothetical protein